MKTLISQIKKRLGPSEDEPRVKLPGQLGKCLGAAKYYDRGNKHTNYKTIQSLQKIQRISSHRVVQHISS